MSKRLQVLLPEDELREIQQIARRRRLTVAEWVRQSLREARRREPLQGEQAKLLALTRATRHEFPTGDIEEILGDIAAGRETPE